ncbi:hypothetical protein D3C87_1928760 [compost metagenome]
MDKFIDVIGRQFVAVAFRFDDLSGKKRHSVGLLKRKRLAQISQRGNIKRAWSLC